jgi:hypothetical protein
MGVQSVVTDQAIARGTGASSNLLDELASVHEAAHTVFAYVSAWPIHDVRIEGQGFGGGQFRTHDGDDTMPLLTGHEAPIHVSVSDKARRDWLKTLVSFCVPRIAQNKYAGTVGDEMCSHDAAIISRILSSISRSLENERRMRAEIEDEAREFVDEFWGEILLVARQLFKHGRLDRQQIASILRALPTKIALNQTGADYASDLVAAGKVNWGPFAWDDETDAPELYHLGEDDSGTEPKLYYPHGKGGEFTSRPCLMRRKREVLSLITRRSS